MEIRQYKSFDQQLKQFMKMSGRRVNEAKERAHGFVSKGERRRRAKNIGRKRALKRQRDLLDN